MGGLATTTPSAMLFHSGGPNMARLPERPAEVVLQSKQELITHPLQHSFKLLHYLFV